MAGHCSSMVYAVFIHSCVAIELFFIGHIKKSRFLSYIQCVTFFYSRGSRTESIASLDILVSVFRTAEGATQPRPQSYVAHSPRKIKPSVGCNIFLEAGAYLVGESFFHFSFVFVQDLSGQAVNHTGYPKKYCRLRIIKIWSRRQSSNFYILESRWRTKMFFPQPIVWLWSKLKFWTLNSP